MYCSYYIICIIKKGKTYVNENAGALKRARDRARRRTRRAGGGGSTEAEARMNGWNGARGGRIGPERKGSGETTARESR